ncbi:MAG: aspartate aminotransferase family protein [Flavobacteriaceae bacterium]
MAFKTDIQSASDILERFYRESKTGSTPVLNQEKPEEIIRNLGLETFVQQGGLTGPALKKFLEIYFTYVTRLHHPNYLGHQCAPPHPSSSLGTLVNGFVNNVSSIYEMSPVSATFEQFVVNWMLEKIGWEPMPYSKPSSGFDGQHAAGVLVNGGSMANLTALVIARTHKIPEVWNSGNTDNLTVLLPAESHYSLTKAAGILGVGAKSVHYMEVDAKGRVRPDKMDETLKEVLSKGLIPFAVVANACSTSVGIYDPLDEMAAFCTANELWLHVDGAHGASALVSPRYRGLLKGIENANSVSWDAHKMLQVPSLCAGLLVKDHKHLNHGIGGYQNASYIFHEKDQPGFDSIHNTIETTKSGLAEKMIFVMGAIGEKGLSDYLERQHQLTYAAFEYINGCEDFECAVSPESNILCFRIVGSDELQLQIRNHLTASGLFYITTVVFNGRRYLRLVFMSHNTTLSTVKNLVTEVVRLKESLSEILKN